LNNSLNDGSIQSAPVPEELARAMGVDVREPANDKLSGFLNSAGSQAPSRIVASIALIANIGSDSQSSP